MRSVQTKEIDGHVYEFYQLGAEKAVRVLTKLFKLVGEPLGLLAGGFDLSSINSASNKDVVANAMKALAERLDEEEVVKLIKDLLEPVLCDGKKMQFDIHFQGRIGHLMKVLYSALEVNFKDFFAESGLLLSAIKKQA